jgi:uncharacterized protein (TIGR02391 family)
MPSSLTRLEAIARAFAQLSQQEPAVQPASDTAAMHPFDSRNIHPSLPPKVRELFDDGHYPEATSLAFKYLDSSIQALSNIPKSGFQLMMDAFDGTSPKIKLSRLVSISDKDEQQGYRFIFAGGMQGIRNPRAHDPAILDNPDTCLDHLGFVSMLLRRLEQAGYR